MGAMSAFGMSTRTQELALFPEFVYLRVAMLNDRWFNRVVSGSSKERTLGDVLREVFLMDCGKLLVQPDKAT
jgi:hypothetical protein